MTVTQEGSIKQDTDEATTLDREPVVIERVQDNCKCSIACDLMLSWRVIDEGVTAQTDRTRENY